MKKPSGRQEGCQYWGFCGFRRGQLTGPERSVIQRNGAKTVTQRREDAGTAQAGNLTGGGAELTGGGRNLTATGRNLTGRRKI